MTIQTATIRNDLSERLNALFISSSKYICTNSIEFSTLRSDIDKLGKVDAAGRLLLLARLYVVAGNLEETNYYLRNAEKLNADSNDFDLAKITMLLSLGYYSDSLPLLEECLKPHRNLQNLFLSNPPLNGAFHMLESAYTHAKSFNLTSLQITNPYEQDVVKIMDFWGDTDADYGTALNSAGEILRERKLFIKYSKSIVKPVPPTPEGCAGYVKLAFIVNVDPDTAIDMTCEFSERLATSGVKIPLSMIFEFESDQ